MNLDRLEDIAARAWLTFVQALNGLLITLLGAALVIHQAYPNLIAQMVGKLPPVVGIPVIVMLGIVIHFALRQAKKNGAKG